jgi:hypothetical protein
MAPVSRSGDASQRVMGNDGTRVRGGVVAGHVMGNAAVRFVSHPAVRWLNAHTSLVPRDCGGIGVNPNEPP